MYFQTDKVRELSQKISETRASVTGVKSTIDSMRTTRDTQMNEMSRLKATLKDQNQRLIAVSQEKIRLEAKNKINSSVDNTEAQEQTQLSVSNKKLSLKSLQDKINDLNSQVRPYLVISFLKSIIIFCISRSNLKNKMLKITTVLLIN